MNRHKPKSGWSSAQTLASLRQFLDQMDWMKTVPLTKTESLEVGREAVSPPEKGTGAETNVWRVIDHDYHRVTLCETYKEAHAWYRELVIMHALDAWLRSRGTDDNDLIISCAITYARGSPGRTDTRSVFSRAVKYLEGRR